MNFIDLDSLYSHLENVPLDFESQINLTRDFIKLASKLNAIDKDKLKYETFALDFELADGVTVPQHSATTKEGKAFQYPSYNDFTEETYKYLADRISQTDNLLLKARYNQVVWNAPKPFRSHQNAIAAVDCYINFLITSKFKTKNEDGNNNILKAIENGLQIAISVSHKSEVFIEYISKNLFQIKEIPLEVKEILVSTVMKHPKLIRRFDGLEEVVLKVSNGYRRTENGFAVRLIDQLGLQVAQKTNGNVSRWNKRIGDDFAREAEMFFRQNKAIVGLEYLRKSIPFYRSAGLERKIKEIETRYSQMKDGLNLTKVSLTIEDKMLTAFAEYLKFKADTILNQDSEMIYFYLMKGTDLFPNLTSLLHKNKKNYFTELMTTVKFDINKNISSPEGKKNPKVYDDDLYKIYHSQVHMMTLPLLQIIFLRGIGNNKITYETFIEFLIKNTWLGQNIPGKDSDGTDVSYNWIYILAPSIHNYFVNMETTLKLGIDHANLILAIDSLTLKFEGALRDFAKMVGVSTTAQSKNEGMREIYIEEILAMKEIRDRFNENDIMVFQYLFISKNGLNLRNNIAHSFFRYNNYSLNHMLLLLCAFLKLGQYKMT